MEVPQHVAIIMDGNGRWAAARGLSRFEGHRRGVEALRRTVRAAGELGIEVLTVYAFSTENWRRSSEEVRGIMALAKRFIRTHLDELHENGVRIRMIGDRKSDRIDPELIALIMGAEKLTRANDKFTLVVAFNYGGRCEIVRAMRRIAEKAAAGELVPSVIDEAVFTQHLDTAGLSDPDLVIRTAGEERLSNFLLWQSAYAEFVSLDIHWPDFDRTALERTIEEYNQRERRFGALPAQRATA